MANITLSEDQLKILIQVLDTLTYNITDSKLVIPIYDVIQAGVKEPTLKVPLVTITPDTIKCKIETKKV